MKKYIILLLITVNFCKAQEIFKDQEIGFEIEKPSDWFIAEKNEALDNIKEKIKLPENQLKEIIKNNKGTIEVVTFYKYDIKSRAGIIPTIKINLRNNPSKSLESFKNSIEASYGKLKEIFPDFVFLTKPSIIKVNGKDCIFSVSKYTVKTRTTEEKVRSYIYAIPVNGTFYQIAFMDTEKDNCKNEFEKAIKSIKITSD
ncbi:hypothetical protein SAMN05660845_0641 [Flavobacterium swingsii]|uniref:PsbP protein n=1 Tax=Flavobacterium swingsii TaxID=498292 RepID=A0A1I0WA20_9FLAO|nr:hypothetical protein [Flavobacterium swingsii]SFA85451.1 hypothetical protein SAMN05660845_0641 [Flavobacterium swingsii]